MRQAATAAVIVATLWVGAAAALAYGWAGFVAPLVFPGDAAAFSRAVDRARGVLVSDAAGRDVGMMSSDFDRDHLGELGRSLFFEGVAVHPDHKAAPVADAPPVFWRCLVWLEDRGRGGWDNPYGVSFTGVLRIPIAMAGRVLGGRDALTAAGGSTLEMQLARSLWKRYRHNSSTMVRKLREWRAAPALNQLLIRSPASEDGRLFRAWIATHLPLVRGVGGERGGLYGVETAGRFLFGRSADSLTTAQQVVLAAAVRRPLRLRADPVRRQAVFGALVGTIEAPGRAARCLDPAALLRDGRPVVSDPDARRAAVRELRHMAETPHRMPAIDSGFRAALSGLASHPSGPRLEPQRVARRLAPGLQAEIAAELSDRFAAAGGDPGRHLWRGRVAHVATTVDVAASLALRAEALAATNAALAPLRRRTPPRVGATPFGARGGPAFLLLAADAKGRVVRYVSSSFDSAAFGRASARPDWGAFGDGPYDPRRARLSIGSLGKAAAALLIAEAGRDAGARPADDRVSNTCLPGFRDRCMSRATDVGGVPSATPETAFGASLNSATIRLIRRARVSEARIAQLADVLSLHVDPRDDAPGATRLALGRYAARPAEMLRLMAAAGAYAQGAFDAEIPAPTVIGRLSGWDPASERPQELSQTALQPPSTPLSALARPGPDAAWSAAYLRRVLEAPLCLREPAAPATLRRLSGWCADARPDVAAHLAKSGTVGGARARRDAAAQGVDPGFDESAWWIAGAVTFVDGRRYAYLALAGDGGADGAFARRLGAGWLAPAVDALLADLARAGE